MFFLLSGFFILGMTARSAIRGERVALATTWTRLFWRLVPTAGLVLAVSTVVAAVLLPGLDVVAQPPRAAGLGVLRRELAPGRSTRSTTTPSNGTASVAQHFWSLSIQAQFYAAAPLLVLAVARWARSVAPTCAPRSSRPLVAVTLASFAHSVIATVADQAFAYFDARARIWEFALGGVLALVIDRVRLPDGPAPCSAGSASRAS